jgi:hypothetical protein
MLNASKNDYLAGNIFNGIAKNKDTSINIFPIVNGSVGIDAMTID